VTGNADYSLLEQSSPLPQTNLS